MQSLNTKDTKPSKKQRESLQRPVATEFAQSKEGDWAPPSWVYLGNQLSVWTSELYTHLILALSSGIRRDLNTGLPEGPEILN